MAAGVTGPARIGVYASIDRVLAVLLLAGLAANLLIRPVAEAKLRHDPAESGPRASGTDPTSHRVTPALVAAWAFVLLPLAWGVWKTLSKAAALFQ